MLHISPHHYSLISAVNIQTFLSPSALSPGLTPAPVFTPEPGPGHGESAVLPKSTNLLTMCVAPNSIGEKS